MFFRLVLKDESNIFSEKFNKLLHLNPKPIYSQCICIGLFPVETYRPLFFVFFNYNLPIHHRTSITVILSKEIMLC